MVAHIDYFVVEDFYRFKLGFIFFDVNNIMIEQPVPNTIYQLGFVTDAKNAGS